MMFFYEFGEGVNGPTHPRSSSTLDEGLRRAFVDAHQAEVKGGFVVERVKHV